MTKINKKTGLNISQQRRLNRLSDRKWRLNNLYWIIDEEGNPVKFKMNPVQERLYRRMWFLNVIPKSRQHGITTFIAIFILDACLFNSNTRAGIIAHRLQDAKKILRDKILYAYHRLPADLKAFHPLKTESTEEVVIAHGEFDTSTIWVATSMRSGTLQILHISEYGKLCARMPVKAQEVKTGAMPTIHKGGFIFVESTAEGPFGDFYDMCLEATTNDDKDLTRLDWRCHFFGWMDKLSNVVDGVVDIPEHINEYLDKLEKVYDRTFTINQRAWYALTRRRFKHDMFKEHPSTMDECFMASVEGAYYGMEIAQMREEGRICSVPHYSEELVHTICDLGVGSHMPWLFFQFCGKEVHIINEFCLGKNDAQFGAVEYRGMLNKFRERHRYQYGKHFAPVDVNRGQLNLTGVETVLKTFASGGIHLTKLTKEPSVHDGIERTRHMMDVLYLDQKCKGTIMGISAYHREWIEALGTYQEKPKGDGASHWADAVRYLSMVHKKGLCVSTKGLTLERIKKWTNKYARVG